MGFVRSAIALALAVGVTVSAAHAQALRKDDGPAEYPPASFQGRQFVDSQGCVYIRAGYAGQVSWVPRVGRDRKVLCGFSPTFAKAATRPAPAQVRQPQAPVRVARPAPTAQAPRAVQPSQPEAPVRVVRRTTTAPQAAPKPTAPKRVVRTAPAVKPRQPACPGASALSARYINDGSKYPVRCGPQEIDPTAGSVTVRPGSRAGSSPATVPLRPAPLTVPEGYERVWEDGRLNPHRGRRTARGELQMAQIWTDEVPRRLIQVPMSDPRVIHVSTQGKSR
ncbi:hypothetical protein [Rhodovulum adriaticum]|uniref:Uncharacterized protein n=1 Tax=Rhodovulum adriaticum TaxID=35804 RepID=A0A4R2NID4_RHOAD|nr:hypothetical protein [Rhodovulum adriaticum]MBK1635822.1 hypothetical protein [Rhodovulum adriaticum]TCP21012.1 hypothetical protein EV656_11430 [Rhodovulum adriaticum]